MICTIAMSFSISSLQPISTQEVIGDLIPSASIIVQIQAVAGVRLNVNAQLFRLGVCERRKRSIDDTSAVAAAENKIVLAGYKLKDE